MASSPSAPDSAGHDPNEASWTGTFCQGLNRALTGFGLSQIPEPDPMNPTMEVKYEDDGIKLPVDGIVRRSRFGSDDNRTVTALWLQVAGGEPELVAVTQLRLSESQPETDEQQEALFNIGRDYLAANFAEMETDRVYSGAGLPLRMVRAV